MYMYMSHTLCMYSSLLDVHYICLSLCLYCRYSNPQSFVLSTPTTPAQDPSIEDQVTSAGTVHCT